MKKSHANKDAASRRRKAENVLLAISNIRGLRQSTKVLNIGTGSGIMDSIWAKKVSLSSVDIVDERIRKAGYKFQVYDGNILPFPNNYFDIAISNQTLEHISYTRQKSHIRECLRILKKEGIMYLATPNKWSIIEPHYRVPLLGLLPKSLADKIISVKGYNNHFDINSLSFGALLKITKSAGFKPINYVPWALKNTRHNSVWRLFPHFILDKFTILSPSFILILEK